MTRNGDESATDQEHRDMNDYLFLARKSEILTLLRNLVDEKHWQGNTWFAKRDIRQWAVLLLDECKHNDVRFDVYMAPGPWRYDLVCKGCGIFLQEFGYSAFYDYHKYKPDMEVNYIEYRDR